MSSWQAENVRNLSNPLDLYDTEDYLTLFDIHKLTPLATDLMVRCKISLPGTYRRQALNGSNCSKYITVDKYFKQQYMCYRFVLNDSRTARINSRLKRSLEETGMFYEIGLDLDILADVDIMEVSLYTSRLYPRANKAFAVHMARELNFKTKQLKFNYFPVTFWRKFNYLLPPPYNTNCLNYNSSQMTFMSQGHCIDGCLIANLKKRMGRIPFTALTRDHYKYPPLSAKLLKIGANAKLVDGLEKQCIKTCNQPECSETLYVTEGLQRQVDPEYTFRVFSPHRPTVLCVFKPKLRLSEYLAYLISSFGVWFSFCFLNLSSILITIVFAVNKMRKTRKIHVYVD